MAVNMDEQNTTGNIKIPNKDTETLKKHFSHCFDKNGNFDFEKFKKEVSKNEIDFSKESYGMDWLGKSYARLLASDEATTLLKEDEKWNQKEENKESENLLIKGDNLEVLKHLSNAYYEKIKMIYIDPPYNTGSDGFVYQDDRKFTSEELSQLAGIDEDKAQRILDFTQSKNNSHSAWLTFMYPRLYIAKQLLKDDGVIFISIDDNEVAQLRLLMDEIFGEDNFVDTVIWERKRGRDNSAKWFSKSHEYILVYAKKKDDLIIKTLEINEKTKKAYKNPDNDPRDKYRMLATWARGTQGGVKYSFRSKDGREFKERLWLFGKEKLSLMDKDNRLLIRGDNIYRKLFLNEHTGRIAETIWSDVSNTANASDEIKKLFEDIVFDTSKPIPLIKQVLKLSTNPNDLILDFFAGSGTTGDAVMQLNAEDGGNRKYILVQLPEEIDPKKNKTAYDFVKNELGVENPTIFDITKERLIRAGNKIQEDNKDRKASSEKVKCDGCGEDGEHCLACKGEYTVKIEATKKKDLSKQDFGFKIFDTTPIWEDYDFQAERFDEQQKLFDESKLSDEDIKTLLTTWKTYDGIALAESLEEIDLDGYKGYYFGTKLYLVNKGFKTKNLKKLLEEIDENKDFNPASIILFGYNFESKVMREIAENVKSYANKKHIDIDFISRY